MYLLYCVHLFLIPMGLSPVSLCFGTAGVVTRCFLTSWGRCFEEGVEKLAIMFSCSFPLLLSDSFLSAMFPLPHCLTLTLFLCDPPSPYISRISVSYGDPGWPRFRQKSWKTRKKRWRREGTCQGGVYRKQPYLLGQIASQEAPQVHTQTDRQTTECMHHTYILNHVVAVGSMKSCASPVFIMPDRFLKILLYKTKLTCVCTFTLFLW